MKKTSRREKPRFERKPWLILRNGFTVAATVMFMISILFDHRSPVLKFAAYLAGMVAYFCEFGFLTKGFHQKVPHDEMFMVYCFAPLYLLLGISYLLH